VSPFEIDFFSEAFLITKGYTALSPFTHLLVIPLSGLFDGEHILIIDPISENKVKFIQREKSSGLLPPLLWSGFDRDTRRGFNEMNAALKKLAEDANE
jgi:hypothetical protein